MRVDRIVAAVDCSVAITRTTSRPGRRRRRRRPLRRAPGEITSRTARWSRTTFGNYPLLRIGEMPRVETHRALRRAALGHRRTLRAPVAPAIASSWRPRVPRLPAYRRTGGRNETTPTLIGIARLACGQSPFRRRKAALCQFPPQPQGGAGVPRPYAFAGRLRWREAVLRETPATPFGAALLEA